MYHHYQTLKICKKVAMNKMVNCHLYSKNKLVGYIYTKATHCLALEMPQFVSPNVFIACGRTSTHKEHARLIVIFIITAPETMTMFFFSNVLRKHASN